MSMSSKHCDVLLFVHDYMTDAGKNAAIVSFMKEQGVPTFVCPDIRRLRDGIWIRWRWEKLIPIELKADHRYRIEM